jgi:hypothetical protein
MTEPKKTISARERAKDIALMTDEGMSSRAIAKAMGISHVRVCMIANRFNIILSRRGTRRLGFYCPETTADRIVRFAARRGVSTGAMLVIGARALFGESDEVTERMLGKLVQPLQPRKKRSRP